MTGEIDSSGPEPLLGSPWFRSDGYVLEDGMLRLRPGAAVEPYDPWEAWQSAADEERPYKRLLRLVQQLGKLPRGPVELAPHQRQLLEQWVRRNGLLGILAHETLEATLAPRWRDERADRPQGSFEPAGVRVYVPVQRRWQRTALGWRLSLPRPAYARETDPALEGQLVGEERLGAPWLAVEALARTLPEARFERRPLGAHYQRYFAEVGRDEADTYPYPSFGSDEFWPTYGEPLHTFVRAAGYLAEPLAALERMRGEELDEDDLIIAWRAIRRLNAIASVVSLAGGITTSGAVAVQWTSPSLLGCFANMLLSDLAAGQQVKRCPNCGVFFVSANRRAAYCSSTCRYAFQKRAWRKNQAEKPHEGKQAAPDAG